MIVQFSINPMDSEHMSGDINRIIAYLNQSGVEYTVGPIGTSIQGPWDTIMPVIRDCHQMIVRDHARVLTTITIDDHKNKEHTLTSAVESSVTDNDLAEYVSHDQIFGTRSVTGSPVPAPVAGAAFA